MEHDDPMERGELVPLMNKSCSRHGDNEILKEERDESQLQNKHYDRRAPAIILGFAFFESIASFGISTNLVVYLSSVLHESNASSAANVAIWIGTCYFTPLIGALIADTFLGNYKTILISLVLSLLGSTMITLSALMLPSCDGGSCHNSASGSDQNVAFFFSGLYLVAVGSGGVKSAALPFGANQFNDKRSEEIGRRSSFFNFFYLCISAGILISTTLIVWLQEHVDWALGFGISTVCIAVALGGFLLGTPTYHLQTPKGTPLKNVLQVLVAAFSKRRLEVPLDCTLMYEVDDRIDQNIGRQKLPHTDQFRFLDKAATISYLDAKDQSPCSSWSLCTVTQVEELKILLRLLPIWISAVVYSAAYCQMATTFIQQGTAMNTKIRSFTVPPASLTCFQVVCSMAWVPFYNRIIVPLARSTFKNETGLTQLQRIAIGQFLMVLSMATAALVEFRRLGSGGALSIAWQLPQYFVVAGSEVFFMIALQELFYSQAPAAMKCLCTSFTFLSNSMGSYLGSLIVALVARLTTAGGRRGWLPDDLNESHMDYYFLLLTGLCALNFSFFVVCASNYTPKEAIVDAGS